MDMLFNIAAVQKYEKLMYKIATSFGFNNSESNELVIQAGFYAIEYFAGQENRFASRILLSKIVVRKCIARLSDKVFSQNPCSKKESGVLGYYSDSKSSYRSVYEAIPLSLRTVYILNNTIGFNQVEIAEILNITLIRVKERFNKARFLLNNCPNVS